jgi:cyclopropane-fatty-acyl-phospholipid synthase
MMLEAIRRTDGYYGVSRDAAQRHYDVSDEFFRSWLGPSLAYACALWADGDDLEQAQVRKMDYLIEQAGVRPGDHVLDIGCGYGGELKRMLAEYGAGRAVGITLSRAQVDWLRAENVPDLEVRLENWVDHRPARPYDAIISVEALEHFARPGMPARRKVAAYRNFFRTCHGLLRPGGMLVVQTISWGHRFPLDINLLRDMYVATTVYPECNPSFLGEIVRACDGIFDVVAVRNDHDHYARTVECWVRRLDEDWERAVGLVGPKKAADFKRCMTAAVRMFAEGWFYLHRLTLRPLPRPVPPARRFLVNNVLGR